MKDQIYEMRKEFDESRRPIIEVELIFERRTFFGLRFINRGSFNAQNVKISFDDFFINSICEPEFKDLLNSQKEKTLIIGAGQKHDIYFGTSKYIKSENKTSVSGRITYLFNGEEYRDNFKIDLQNYATIFSIDNYEDDLVKELKHISKEISKLNRLN